MFKAFFSTIALILILGKTVSGQADSLNVMFYNVENLFDIQDDSSKNDNEFLPDSKKSWTKTKWKEKTTKIAKVIAAANFPDVIGFAEIENLSVLQLLTQHFILQKQQYKIIHFESPDLRGIDCALIYKANKFNLLYMKPIKVDLTKRPTRDILITTLAYKRDTISFLVNHWPSRYGGKNKSAPKRLMAGLKLKEVMDSLKSLKPNNKIIAMGDFNDEPKDPSLKTLKDYKNLSDQIKGTIKYRGNWQNFDQFITSNNVNYSIKTLNFDFLLEPDKTYGGLKPNRTYFGPMYHGGFSDHLPILLTFSLP